MKIWKRWTAIGVVAAAAVSLSACARGKQENQPEELVTKAPMMETGQVAVSPQEAIAEAAVKLAGVQSLDAEITVDMGIKVLGQQFDAQAVMDMSTFQSPMKMKADLCLDLGILGSSKMQAYAQEKDGKYGLYVYDGTKWSRQEARAADLKKYNGQKVMNIYLDKIGEINLEAAQTLEGKTADKYSGVIHGDTLKEVFQNSGITDSMGALMSNDVLKPLSLLLQNHGDLIQEVLEGAQDIPVSLWIDRETGYPVQCSMDITDIVGDIFTQVNKKSSGKISTANLLSEVSISKTNITVKCGSFDEAEDFTVPAEALGENESAESAATVQ